LHHKTHAADETLLIAAPIAGIANNWHQKTHRPVIKDFYLLKKPGC